MKKLIGTVAVAALLASAAFAEITFGAWLRVVAAPVASDGDDILSGMTNSWGYGARPARLNISATSEDEKVGFSMGVYNDAWDGIAAGDDVVIWARPWDWLKISLGQWDYTTFRGDLAYGSWEWIRPVNWIIDDEGLTFDKLGAKNGIQLELAPVEGLLIMWNLPLAKGFNKFNDKSDDYKVGATGNVELDDDGNPVHADKSTTNYAYKMFEQQDIAAKYTIGDIGTIKLGWGGQGKRNDNDDKYLGDINVAFDLTAVENLFLTVGVKIPVASSDYKDGVAADAYKNVEKGESADLFKFIKAALGVSYQVLDNLKISASYGMQTYSKYDAGVTVKELPRHQFGIGVDVGLTDSLTLNADFRGLLGGGYKMDGEKVDDSAPDPQFSFLLGLRYNVSSNGYVGIGFQGSTGDCGFLKDSWGINPSSEKEKAFCWAVPIAVSVWF